MCLGKEKWKHVVHWKPRISTGCHCAAGTLRDACAEWCFASTHLSFLEILWNRVMFVSGIKWPVATTQSTSLWVCCTNGGPPLTQIVPLWSTWKGRTCCLHCSPYLWLKPSSHTISVTSLWTDHNHYNFQIGLGDILELHIRVFITVPRYKS